MAQPFLDHLNVLAKRHVSQSTEYVCKHFFSGAALYIDGAICATLTPVGLAFKLPQELCTELILAGQACELRYFEKSPVKVGYALFVNPESLSAKAIRKYFKIAITQATSNSV